jgi:hypothetical protein
MNPVENSVSQAYATIWTSCRKGETQTTSVLPGDTIRGYWHAELIEKETRLLYTSNAS